MDDAHRERLCAARNFHPDPPHPDEAESRAGEIAAEQLRSSPALAPAPLAHEAVRRHEVSAARKDQRQRQVGNGSVEHARRIGDGDPARSARGDVDRVVADPVVGDEPEVGEEVELFRADPDDRRDEHVDARQRLRGWPRVQQLGLRELVPRRTGKPLRCRDAHTAVSPEAVAERA